MIITDKKLRYAALNNIKLRKTTTTIRKHELKLNVIHNQQIERYNDINELKNENFKNYQKND